MMLKQKKTKETSIIKNYKFKYKVGIQTIKVVKQETDDGSYYSVRLIGKSLLWH